MSSNYYKGLVSLLNGFLNVAMIGLYTASSEGAGFQSLEMITDGGADSS